MAEYLPGTIGERIIELREGAGLTIEELAVKVGVNATTLGRMEKGQTQKIGDDVLTALAREFNVSTDFLLGLTSIPDRKNYDIAELGLSAQAARNLYTRKVNADVVNRLLEHPRFAVLTAMIAQYLDDAFAAGVAVQNQFLSSMSDILLGIGRNEPEQSAAAKEAVRAFNLSKVPPHQVELTKMQNTFMAVLRQIDKEIPYHILFLLEYEGKYQAWTAYKEAAGSGTSAFTVGSYYHTDWMEEAALPLKLDGLNTDKVYESFVQQIAGETLPGENETLKESVERDKRRQELQKQIAALQVKVRREKQFNRQVEMNGQLKKLKKEMEELK